MILTGGVVIVIVSFVLALRALSELELPDEVKSMIKQRKNKISGVIVFFRKKVVHYSSPS